MEQAEQLLAGLGGAENIIEIEPCITRLRIELKDPLKLNEDILADSGVNGGGENRSHYSTNRRLGRRQPGSRPRKTTLNRERYASSRK